MTLKTERRTQHRKRPLSLVYVELPPANGGMMRDLSEQGFSLRAMMPVSPSEKIPFSFVLDASSRIEGDAIVLRVEDGGRVAAMEFAGLPAHCRDQIRRWLEKSDEPISPESDSAQPTPSKPASLTELRMQIRAAKAPLQPERVQAIPPPAPEPTHPRPLPRAEVAPPQRRADPPLNAEPPDAPSLAIVESAPLPPPVVATEPPTPEPLPIVEAPQPPAQIMMALPKPAPPPPQEAPPLPPPQSKAKVVEREGPPLPPLLKLSSVRPGPVTAGEFEEPAASIEVSASSAVEPPPTTLVSLPKAEPPSEMEKPVIKPVPAPAVVHRRTPPALEPLSSLEGETDSDNPGWMDRFTLGRAVGIMLFLTLLAGSYVYHRELGQALIWLGHQIAGDESQENSKSVRPAVPSALHQAPEQSPAARPVEPPSPIIQHSNATTEPTSANLPAATDKTPSPQLKGGSSGSLVPLTQVTRPPVPTPSGDNSVEPGQSEYLQALQILRSPGRSSEVPAAIQLLWVAVEKGNTGAEIDLAELFRTGRGVAKNCDQTRILLSAAARKGSTEARKRLEAFQRQGCGN